MLIDITWEGEANGWQVNAVDDDGHPRVVARIKRLGKKPMSSDEGTYEMRTLNGTLIHRWHPPHEENLGRAMREEMQNYLSNAAAIQTTADYYAALTEG